MGITRECLSHYASMVKNKELNWPDCDIIELGAQTVHFDDKELFKEFCEVVGTDPSVTEGFFYNMTGRQMHEAFGNRYECIDLDDFNGQMPVLKWDLNDAVCPEEHKSKYDLVTNFGTTEHLFNQTNAFRLIHDLTNVGGKMLHILPMADMNHGLFNYNPVLFISLAKSNNYEVLHMFMTSNHEPSVFVPYQGYVEPGKTYLHVILKKMTSDEFVNPAQVFDSGNFNSGQVYVPS